MHGRAAHWLGLLGNRLLAGIAFAVPLVVTYWILTIGYRFITGLSEPWLKTFGINFPGLGFLITLVAFIGLGFMATHVLGRRVLDGFERLVLRIPLVSAIYAGTKQLMHSLRGIGTNTQSKRVVMVEYVVPGSRLFGFATGQVIEAGTGRELTTIFVPTSPNPTTGIIIAVPSAKVIECDMSVEEMSKMLFSGGLITPVRPVGIGEPDPDKQTDV